MAETECPHCGATFDARRLACPECGSDAETGWKSEDEIQYSSVEIPDYYDEEPPRGGAGWYWIAAVLALVAMLIFALWR